LPLCRGAENTAPDKILEQAVHFGAHLRKGVAIPSDIRLLLLDFLCHFELPPFNYRFFYGVCTAIPCSVTVWRMWLSFAPMASQAPQQRLRMESGRQQSYFMIAQVTHI